MGVQIDFSKFRISRMEEGEKIEESFNFVCCIMT